MLPKLVFTDIDGVWTDGGMYYDQTGNEWKLFNTSDSAGVVFLRHLNIPTVIITGEDTQIVARRAKKLNITDLHMGIKKKLPLARQICAEKGIDLKDTAYIGDDLGDMPLLPEVGLSACPAQAPEYVKDIVDWVLETKGGQGAFREFVERILRVNGMLEQVLQMHLEKLEGHE